ncbi:hypothetical protein D9M71_780420 [compost metagenome]
MGSRNAVAFETDTAHQRVGLHHAVEGFGHALVFGGAFGLQAIFQQHPITQLGNRHGGQCRFGTGTALRHPGSRVAEKVVTVRLHTGPRLEVGRQRIAHSGHQ